MEKNKPLENTMDSLKESGYKVEKQKYNFTPKEDSDLYSCAKKNQLSLAVDMN